MMFYCIRRGRTANNDDDDVSASDRIQVQFYNSNYIF